MAAQDFDIKIRTTADTAGVKQTEADLKRLQSEAEKGGAAAGASIGRLIAPFVSAFSAFKFIDQINTVAERLKQNSAELAKQGDQLIENAQKYAEMAKSARDEGDIIKIAERALRDVEAAHKRVADAQQEELSLWDKITDSADHAVIQLALMGRASEEAGRVAQHAQDQRIEGQRQIEALARQELIGAIRTSEAYKEQFDRRKAEPFEEALENLNNQLKEQQALLKATDFTVNPESWLAISKTIERIKGDLAEIYKLHKGEQPLTKTERLQQQLGEFSKLGERKDLTPAEQTAAREGYVRSQTALRDAQVKAEKDARDAEAEARRKRYEGEGIPTEPKLGQTTGSFNADVLEVLRRLLAQWQ